MDRSEGCIIRETRIPRYNRLYDAPVLDYFRVSRAACSLQSPLELRPRLGATEHNGSFTARSPVRPTLHKLLRNRLMAEIVYCSWGYCSAAISALLNTKSTEAPAFSR